MNEPIPTLMWELILCLPCRIGKYQSRSGTVAPLQYCHYLPYGYDATNILLQALDRVASAESGGLRINQRQLADAVRAVSGSKGVTGLISITIAC